MRLNKHVVFRFVERLVSTAAMTFLLICFLYPIFWLITTSLKPRLLAFALPPAWIFPPTFDNYVEVFLRSDFIRAFFNSVIIAVSSSIVTQVLAIPGAYGLARYKFRGKYLLSLWTIIIRMVPAVAFIIPLYLWLQRLGLLNTFVGIVLTYLIFTLPMTIFLLRTFFLGIPVALEEAAALEGCSRVRTLILVTLPLALPGVITSMILSFIQSWNEFLYVLVIGGRSTRTLPITIQTFITFEGVNWGQLTAAGVLVTLPVLLFGVLMQKGLVKGLTMGSLK
jgi:multiple sugar transport system permease protein